MNQDNQKDVPLSTIPQDDATVPTAESSETKRELNDDEIASVDGGISPILGPYPPHGPVSNVSTPAVSRPM